jgi:hypothetical protein
VLRGLASRVAAPFGETDYKESVDAPAMFTGAAIVAMRGIHATKLVAHPFERLFGSRVVGSDELQAGKPVLRVGDVHREGDEFGGAGLGEGRGKCDEGKRGCF